MLLLQLEINSTRDVWKFCQIRFGQNFQTSLRHDRQEKYKASKRAKK